MKKIFFFLAAAIVVFAGCKKDDSSGSNGGGNGGGLVNGGGDNNDKCANCIVVTDSKTYSIDATVRGNGVLPEGLDESEKNGLNLDLIPDDVKLIWQEEAGWITSLSFNKEKKQIEFATKGTPGNALVASMTEYGLILWSWHIWNPGEGVEIDKVNLGSTSKEFGNPGVFGLHYQWGRKEPFPSGSKIKYIVADGNVTVRSYYDDKGNAVDFTRSGATGLHNTLQTCIVYPTEYQTNKWLSGTVDYLKTGCDDLWGGESKKKTLLDPCPAGYRVSRASDFMNPKELKQTYYAEWTEFGGWNVQQRVGEDWETLLYIPAAGSYDGETGIYRGGTPGYKGYYWLSDKESDGRAKSVVFDDNGIQYSQDPWYDFLSTASPRSDAFTVRCLKDE